MIVWYLQRHVPFTFPLYTNSSDDRDIVPDQPLRENIFESNQLGRYHVFHASTRWVFPESACQKVTIDQDESSVFQTFISVGHSSIRMECSAS